MVELLHLFAENGLGIPRTPSSPAQPGHLRKTLSLGEFGSPGLRFCRDAFVVSESFSCRCGGSPKKIQMEKSLPDRSPMRQECKCPGQQLGLHWDASGYCICVTYTLRNAKFTRSSSKIRGCNSSDLEVIFRNCLFFNTLAMHTESSTSARCLPSGRNISRYFCVILPSVRLLLAFPGRVYANVSIVVMPCGLQLGTRLHFPGHLLCSEWVGECGGAFFGQAVAWETVKKLCPAVRLNWWEASMLAGSTLGTVPERSLALPGPAYRRVGGGFPAWSQFAPPG